MLTRFGGKQGAEVTDRETKVAFPVPKGATLLDAIESAGLKINYGCRAGLCGADAVVVCEGGKHLSPAGDDELATLRRLGLEGKARLACMCRVSGPVVIDRDPTSAGPEQSQAAPAAPEVDHAVACGVSRVVIIGNGIAGTSAAEQLRRLSASLQIDMITSEPLHFYNRMAIGRLIYGRTGMDGLQLIPDNWYTRNRVEVWRNSIARSVDRQSKSVLLATGESLPYDKLILATGAHCTTPDPDFLAFDNAFVLRSAEDAQALRNYVQLRRARRALVVGGGVLGVEAADALHHLGLHVTLLQRSDRLMNAQLDHQGAARLASYLEGIGIEVLTDVSISRWEGQGETLRAAWLAHGPCARADVFVACLGIGTNTQLARAAGLEVGRGVKVDSCMRTSDPDIFAVGDVAELPGAVGGLWTVGAAQAATAAGAVLGQGQPYQAPRIVLQLKCDGIDLRSFGEISARPGDEEYTAAPERCRMVAPDPAPGSAGRCPLRRAAAFGQGLHPRRPGRHRPQPGPGGIAARRSVGSRLAGIGPDTEQEFRFIGLVGRQQIDRELGRFAETDRQQPAGHGIECAGVPGLGCRKQPPGRLQRRIRGHPSRLVKEQHAIDTAPAFPNGHDFSRHIRS
jgi:nitrite reductase (NADH) large subunit